MDGFKCLFSDQGPYSCWPAYMYIPAHCCESTVSEVQTKRDEQKETDICAKNIFNVSIRPTGFL